MLRRYSARTNLAGVYRSDNNNPATHTGLDIATTSGPAGYTVPAYNIAIQRRIPQGFFNRLHRAMSSITMGDDPYEVYARLVITRNADQGQNDSLYLGGGLYANYISFNECTDNHIQTQITGTCTTRGNS